MPNSSYRRGTLVLLAVISVSPIVLRAQFQAPNDAELKMTSDPKAPGAAAVYLDYQEIADDPHHFQSVYARIKVLTEKGKELATVTMPYFKGAYKISAIKGRTIHSDGTVIPLSGKPEDLVVVKTSEGQVGKRVFTLPSVEVGSVLEYSFQLEYDENIVSSPTWKVQLPYFVHKAHYEFRPQKDFQPGRTLDTVTTSQVIDSRGRVARSLIWWSRLPPGVTVKVNMNGLYELDAADVPAAPDEEWMPPIESFLYRVGFFYSFAHDANEFWASEVKLWSKDVDRFADPSKKIKSAVAGLIGPGDSDLDKAKKLYDAVQALDNTDYSRAKSESEMKQLKLRASKRAEDVWSQKSGSGDDIAMLYLAMLRAAGLNADAIRIVDRDRGVFDPSNLSLEQFDATLVGLNTSDGMVVLDPGEKMCPFRTVNWRHSDATGIAQSAQGGAMITTPTQEYKENVVARTGDVNLDAQGGVTGQAKITMSGQEALRWRQKALENDEGELKKQFDKDLEAHVPEGVEAHVDHFVSIGDPYTNLTAIVNLKGTLGAATAKRILLPGFFFETRGHAPFVNEEKRQAPVDMQYGNRATSDVTYHLPEGVAVEAVPQGINISWMGHALLDTNSIKKPGAIEVGQSLSIAFTLLKPEEYQDLRGFFQQVAAADQEQVILTKSSTGATPLAGKGN